MRLDSRKVGRYSVLNQFPKLATTLVTAAEKTASHESGSNRQTTPQYYTFGSEVLNTPRTPRKTDPASKQTPASLQPSHSKGRRNLSTKMCISVSADTSSATSQSTVTKSDPAPAVDIAECSSCHTRFDREEMTTCNSCGQLSCMFCECECPVILDLSEFTALVASGSELPRHAVLVRT